MSEIKCPHCGEVFKVDEQGYAAIVAQVKTAEFDKELDKRVADEKRQGFEACFLILTASIQRLSMIRIWRYKS